ncbi:hypothetical protein PENSPDRAFT_678995 [Peniophora sp. CONT]|nr:hypothetical protein PENSPDRAFT_678995 [Peniophora sp. CONT]
MDFTETPAPVSLGDVSFEGLVEKLLKVLEITQRSQGSTTPQAKQELLRSIEGFRDSLKQAKKVATELPGGELLVEEQDGIIVLLEKIRDKKRQQLAVFSQQVVTPTSRFLAMDVDSTASTPS